MDMLGTAEKVVMDRFFFMFVNGRGGSRTNLIARCKNHKIKEAPNWENHFQLFLDLIGLHTEQKFYQGNGIWGYKFKARVGWLA